MALRALLCLVTFVTAALSAPTHAHTAPSPHGVQSIAAHHHATSPAPQVERDLCALCRSGRDLAASAGHADRVDRLDVAPRWLGVAPQATPQSESDARDPAAPRAPPSVPLAHV